jgi:hypothetical protein
MDLYVQLLCFCWSSIFDFLQNVTIHPDNTAHQQYRLNGNNKDRMVTASTTIGLGKGYSQVSFPINLCVPKWTTDHSIFHSHLSFSFNCRAPESEILWSIREAPSTMLEENRFSAESVALTVYAAVHDAEPTDWEYVKW